MKINRRKNHYVQTMYKNVTQNQTRYVQQTQQRNQQRNQPRTTKTRKRRLDNDDDAVKHNKTNDIADTEKIAKKSAKSRQILTEQEPPKERKKLSLKRTNHQHLRCITYHL